MIDESINKDYLDYLDNHPEIVKNAPPSASCLTMHLRNIDKGKTTHEEVNRSANAVRNRWENYHLEMAKSLGFELSIEEFVWQRSSAYQELKSIQRNNREDRKERKKLRKMGKIIDKICKNLDST